MNPIFALILGIVIGVVIGYFLFSRRKDTPVGNLRIDQSDPDGPYLFLELDQPIGNWSRQKDIRLTVKNENYASHK